MTEQLLRGLDGIRTVRRVCASAVMALVVPTIASAQATGTISGLVTDATDAAIPAASIEVTNEETGLVRRSTTAPDGVYVVPLLPPGIYRVKVSHAGFSSVIRDGVRVSVSETTRANVVLPVGPITAEITVTRATPLVETSHATLGIVIDERMIVDLPLNGRSFAQLATLVPGVVAASQFLGGAAGDATPGGLGNPTGSFNVNGMRSTSNDFRLDGASNNDTLTSGFVLRPPPDAIEEFRILTHSYEAQYGRNAGSIVDVVTKSGTNTWSGAAWEFNRDDLLQARNYFADPRQPKPTLEQNQFGATLGGPIARNKLLAFGYYEGYRRRAGSTVRITVPSGAQRAGDFSGLPTIRDPETGQPFPGNMIPQARLDPIALRLLNDFVPLENTGPNAYTASPVVRDTRNQAGVRLDYHPSGKHAILGRYLWSRTNQITPPTVQPSAQVAGATLQDVMLSHSYIARSSLINVARVSANLIRATPAVASGLRNSDYGINLPNTNPRAVGLSAIAITGYLDQAFTLGDQYRIFLERQNETFQFVDDLTWVRGRHSWKAGVEVRRDHIRAVIPQRPNGNLVFTGGITGDGAADFLLGHASQISITTTQAIQDGHSWLFGAYVQNQFRISPALTLNAGLRYELPIPYVDRNDAIAGIDMSKQSVRFPDAPRGLVYPGDPGVPRGIVPTDTNNFAPRLGLVWDPGGQGRTTIRAAWGTFYDTLPATSDFYLSGVLAPPFSPSIALNSPTRITLADPLASVSAGPALFPPNLILLGWGTDFQTPYSYHYNLGVQQQIGADIAVEIGYVGTRGKHLPVFIETNPGVYEPGQTIRGARTLPAFSTVRPTFSDGESWYDALQASVRLRPKRGLSALAAYTWSHAVDHMSAPNLSTEPRPMLPAIQGDRASVRAALAHEKGDALFDVRHRFIVSFSYEGPTLESRGALARGLFGGWQLHGIVQAQSGFPLNVTEGANTDIRYLTARPDVTCDPNDGPRTVAEWFDTSCFTRRTLAETGERPGNAGRNNVRGPGFSRTDIAFVKDFAISREQRLELRVEAFNVFNQVHLDQPSGTIGTTDFGRITATAGDNRIVQLGIKYRF